MSVKKNGRVYTPKNIVNEILNSTNYYGKNILEKHIIDNSCGDGAFLKEIVKRYCDEYLLESDNLLGLKKQLEKYIHGIEIDGIEYQKTIRNLNEIINGYGINDVNWDILNANTLNVEKYNNKMDYVIGNPPYVRVHNLGENFEKIKQMRFSNKGMTDLFIVFYEIGINMLNKTGKLTYITPNSIYSSLAGTEFRKYIIENVLLKEVINLRHYQPFDKITTYTTILLLDKENSNKTVKYFELNEAELKYIDTLSYDTFYLNDKFYFSKEKNLKKFKEIMTIKNDKNIKVKNGLATLGDGIFIKNKFEYNSENIIPIIKASTEERKEIIFPYDENCNILNFENLDNETQKYLFKHKDQLESRSIEKNAKWYSYGRSQAIKDIFEDKVTINTLIKEIKNLKIIKCDKGTAVYSGLYILGLEYNVIEKILRTNDFIEYVKIIGKYKNGGYYTFSSGDLEKYLIYNKEN